MTNTAPLFIGLSMAVVSPLLQIDWCGKPLENPAVVRKVCGAILGFGSCLGTVFATAAAGWAVGVPVAAAGAAGATALVSWELLQKAAGRA